MENERLARLAEEEGFLPVVNRVFWDTLGRNVAPRAPGTPECIRAFTPLPGTYSDETTRLGYRQASETYAVFAFCAPPVDD